MTDNGDARKPKDHPVETTEKSLLLIGDFVIDDSWVAGEYHSATATHVGRTHYRSLHHPGSAVKQHCGVGLVAGILHHAQLERNVSNGQSPERCAFAKRVHVLGMWGTSDTEGYLKEMFIPERLMGSNGYRVVPPETKDKPRSARIFLQNLGDALTHQTANLGYSQFLPPEASTTDLSPFVPEARLQPYRATDKYFGTARIVRLFKRTEHRLEQIGRLDWDLSPQSTDDAFPSWLPSGLTDDEKNRVAATLAKGLAEAGGFDAVIIKDNGKGVVSSPLIDLLLNHKALTGLGLSSKPWFIQTKRWEPSYLQILQRQVPIALLVYHSVALRQCPDVGTWITSQNTITPEAMTVLTNVNGACVSETDVARRLCVLLPRHFSAIALVGKTTSKESSASDLLFQPVANPNALPTVGTAGSATAMFSALIYGLLQESDEATHEVVQSRFLLEGAMRVAQRWAKDGHDRLLHADLLNAPQVSVLSLIEPNEADGERTSRKIGLSFPIQGGQDAEFLPDDLAGVGQVKGFDDIDTELERWAQSGKEFALMREGDGEPFLELSRSAIELRDYVCRVPEKRRQISELISRIGGFDARRGRSASGLLLANPGSGKTTLVESLASDLNLHLLSYNLTNMMTFEDLLLSFDQIATAQAENPHRTIMVFVDEINAQIEKQAAYEAFLTPLEDGYYVRAGTKRFVRPCIWLFVGTGSLEDIGKDLKGSDFTSRLTWDPIILSDVPEIDMPYLYIENIYVGAVCARKMFPWVRRLHRDVIAFLGTFGKCEPTASRIRFSVSNRDIRTIIARELVVDGSGRGNWRDFDGLCVKHAINIWPSHLGKNLEDLKKWKHEWVRIYDSYPGYEPK